MWQLGFDIDLLKQHVIEPEVIVNQNIEFIRIELSLFEVEMALVLSLFKVSLQGSNKIFAGVLQGLGIGEQSLAESFTETGQSLLSFFRGISENEISSKDFRLG